MCAYIVLKLNPALSTLALATIQLYKLTQSPQFIIQETMKNLMIASRKQNLEMELLSFIHTLVYCLIFQTPIANLQERLNQN